MAREPFVSGIYKEEEDAQNQRPRRLEDIKVSSKKRDRDKRLRFMLRSKSTPQTQANTRRMLGEKDD